MTTLKFLREKNYDEIFLKNLIEKIYVLREQDDNNMKKIISEAFDSLNQYQKNTIDDAQIKSILYQIKIFLQNTENVLRLNRNAF